jgi:RNA polymerase sigma factor (sigma-70 family)
MNSIKNLDSDKKPDEAVEYWERFRNGDDRAFTFLFDGFSDMLFNYGTKFIADGDTIKDCVQELFIKLYEGRGSLQPTDNVKFFMFRALKNQIIDFLRQNKRLVYIAPDELYFDEQYHIDAAEDDDDINAEIMERYEAALNRLSSRQKEAIHLRYQMEMSYDEIAALLNINYQSTRNLIHRSITKIREELGIRS